ncbi:GNAT family N-acetyltransferase [Pedobacter gandavensis]|uniref:GNAT family N-acetyltransferase n=1 Tax=Pedobacter gandavensis TaxID=2679963 RepID=UPI00293088CE|nr:GNAT family N-acetyltransferase [Pedobacter gandavensis]
MNEEYVSLPLIKHAEEHRFELKVGEYTAFIEYKERDKKIWLIHTESPVELQGKGAATAVIEKTLAYIEDNGYKLIPLCPLVAAYLKRHPDWNRIVD